MVMMALEGLERILQVGELEAKRNDTPNPYASLMASTNIEMLVAHKSAAVAKRYEGRLLINVVPYDVDLDTYQYIYIYDAFLDCVSRLHPLAF
jgi:hypothetical protein